MRATRLVENYRQVSFVIARPAMHVRTLRCRCVCGALRAPPRPRPRPSYFVTLPPPPPHSPSSRICFFSAPLRLSLRRNPSYHPHHNSLTVAYLSVALPSLSISPLPSIPLLHRHLISVFFSTVHSVSEFSSTATSATLLNNLTPSPPPSFRKHIRNHCPTSHPK